MTLKGYNNELDGDSLTDFIAQFLPKRTYLTPLTDPNFIGKTLGSIPKSISQGRGAGTGWRALGTTTEVAHLSTESSQI